MTLNKSRVVALLLGGLTLLWAAALFFGLPFFYSKKVDALVGQEMGVVSQELGVPKRRWEPNAFSCEPAWPCKGAAKGGPVLLYAGDTQAWYLYFDAQLKLSGL